MTSIPMLLADETHPRYRSGAVARMLRMPVATLRIWERRYRVADPATTPSGHRLYSAADVQRLALLKQLTERGHAIGAIAGLPMAQLHEVAATHASVVARPGVAVPRPVWSLAVIGPDLAARLQRPTLRARLARSVEVRAVFEGLAQVQAGQAEPVDALLLQLPGLHLDALEAVARAQQALGARRVGVLYGFASGPALRAFEAAGVDLHRDAVDDTTLATWLGERISPASDTPPPPATTAAAPALGAGLAEPVTRRYDDATLSEFAGLSSAIACECPRHVAELLMQLTRFEAYSAECRNRSPADAELHAYLQRVAGTSRALFEDALERLAIAEGLLPP